MDPDRFPKVASKIRSIGLVNEWKVVCPPTVESRTDLQGRNGGGNRAFALTSLLGSIELDDTRWAITNGWFEREDGIKVYPVYGRWYGSKSNPKPEMMGWYITWQDERVALFPVCGPYAAMKAVDRKWTVGMPMTGRMALLLGDYSAELSEKPVRIPSAKTGNKPIPVVLRALAAQEGTEGEPLLAAAERVEWLEGEVKRLRGKNV